MWFRIETNKDGSIKSCAEVESSRNDGREIYYIEADSKTDALLIVGQRWRAARDKQMGRNREMRRLRGDNGLCVRCGGEPVPGCKKCAGCLEKRRIEYQRRGMGRANVRLEGEGAIAAALRTRERDRRRAKNNPDAYTIGKLVELRKALGVFDSSTPRSFRTWLVERITQLEQKKQRRVKRLLRNKTKLAA